MVQLSSNPLIRPISFFALSVGSLAFRDVTKSDDPVESLIGLLHNRDAFTSPVDEVVAWGEDTWP